MRKLLSFAAGLFFLAPLTAFAACSPVALGGTGWCNLQSTFLLYGNGTSPIATSSALFWTNSLERLSFTNASSTNQNISHDLWLTNLATPAGTILAADPNGLVIATSSSSGTVTSIATTWPISGGPITTTGTINWAGLSTTTNLTTGHVVYSSGVNSITDVATSSVTYDSPLTTSGTPGYIIGGSAFHVGCSTCGTGSVTSITLGDGLFGTTPLTTTGTIYGSVATSATPTIGNLAYWTSIGDATHGAHLGTVATSSSGTASTVVALNASQFTTLPNASTTNLTAGTSLQIPNGSSQTPTVVGYVAQDTTDNQLKLGTGGSTAIFDQRHGISWTSPATTTAWTGTSTAALGPTLQYAYTGTGLGCKTDAGTLEVAITYGPAPTTIYQQASSTFSVFAISPSIGAYATTTWAAGNPASSPTQVNCSLYYTVTGT